MSIPLTIPSYVYQPRFGTYSGTKDYKHHYCCGICGNKIDKKLCTHNVYAHIEKYHPDKLILLQDDPHNNEYTKLINEQDQLEFTLYQLEIIESSLNGSYKGLKHPRFDAIQMQDNKTRVQYQLNKVKQQILSYDLNHNIFIPIMEYENLTTEI